MTELLLSTHQGLALTPQMQHAIKLMHLSHAELTQELSQAVLDNPFLEYEDQQLEFDYTGGAPNPADLPNIVDIARTGKHDQHKQDENFDIFANNADLGHEASLFSYVTWQLNVSKQPDEHKTLAILLLDYLDENGFLKHSLEAIIAEVGLIADAATLGKLTSALKLLQSLEPLGIGARDLAECFLLQIHTLQMPVEQHKILVNILSNPELFALLTKGKQAQLAKILQLDFATLQSAIKQLKKLDAHPGNKFSQRANIFINPELVCRQLHPGKWQVELNAEVLPKIHLYQDYLPLASLANKNIFMKNKLIEAKWLLRNVQNRYTTMLKVARSIINHQLDFLSLGAQAIKPMVLQDIARDTDLHESTISRITTNKFIATPQGVFELKYFFSASLPSRSADNYSALAVQARLQYLIKHEDKAKPLTDQMLALLLQEEYGVAIARRTIVKYRDLLGIGSSLERRC